PVSPCKSLFCCISDSPVRVLLRGMAVRTLEVVPASTRRLRESATKRSRGPEERLGNEPALERREARLQRRRRAAPARQRADRAHAGEERRGKTLEALQRKTVRELARRPHRQPGDAAGEGRRAGDLSLGLAGCGGRERLAR